MARTYLGNSLNPANAPLDTVGIPIVLTTAQRDEDFPAPLDNQRVQNLETAAIERWTGSAWVTDFATGTGGATTEDLVPGIFGENEAPGTFAFENGLHVFGEDGDGYMLKVASDPDEVVGSRLILGNDAGVGAEYAYAILENLVHNTALNIEVRETSVDISTTGGADINLGGGGADVHIIGDTIIDALEVTGDVLAGGNILTTAEFVLAGGGTLSLSQSNTTAVGVAGAATALPANPLGYLRWSLAGTEIRVPYYNA